MTTFVLQGAAPMRDPHVVELIYSTKGQNGVEYAEDAEQEHTSFLGRFRIAGGKLQIEPAQHFASVEEARATIDPYLRAWETETDLRVQAGALRFEFETARLVDRDPAPVGEALPLTLELTGHAMVALSGDIGFKVTRKDYPQPPTDFVLTHELIAAHARRNSYREGREPLASMAYFVFTVMTGRASSQAGAKSGQALTTAAQMYAVDSQVLKKISELTSIRGDFTSARKYLERPAPLTDGEIAWIEQAVKLLILRMGEQAAGKALPKITLAELPPLP